MSTATSTRKRRLSNRTTAAIESPRISPSTSSPRDLFIYKENTRPEPAEGVAGLRGVFKVLRDQIEKTFQQLSDPPHSPGATFSRGLLIFSLLLFLLSALRTLHLIVPWCKVPGLASFPVCQDSSYTVEPYVDTNGRSFIIPKAQHITLQELIAPLSHLEDFGALHGLSFIAWSYDEIKGQVDAIISGSLAKSPLFKPLEGHVTSLKDQVLTLLTKSYSYKDTAVQALFTFKKLTQGLAKSLQKEKPFTIGRYLGFPADVSVQVVTTLWIEFYIAVQKEIAKVRSAIHEYQADMIDLRLETLATKDSLERSYEEADAVTEVHWKDKFDIDIANSVIDRLIEFDAKGDNVTREAEIMLASASWKLSNVIERLTRSMDRNSKPEDAVVATGLARGSSVNEQIAILDWQSRTIHKMFVMLHLGGSFEKE
ncbi:hypothetical protein ACMFMG_009246 [Clarireedia jacksonii]